MINYEELEDVVLFGFEESYNGGGEVLENEYADDWEPQGEEIAEALYFHYMGLD